MKAILAGAAMAAVLATPAFADFYIVQSPTTKRCTIVEQRPAPSAGVVIGSPFGLRVEAESHMKTVEVCHDATVGRSPGGVVIEERERVRER
jgi:hypothetical protein